MSKAEKAAKLGAEAFHAGKPRNPTPDIVKLLEPGAPMGSSIPLFDAWTKAWDRENLKAPVP